jgi:hypothetical protein
MKDIFGGNYLEDMVLVDANGKQVESKISPRREQQERDLLSRMAQTITEASQTPHTNVVDALLTSFGFSSATELP